MIRKKCANCGFIFDIDIYEKGIKCPKCDSNALDDYIETPNPWKDIKPYILSNNSRISWNYKLSSNMV